MIYVAIFFVIISIIGWIISEVKKEFNKAVKIIEEENKEKNHEGTTHN